MTHVCGNSKTHTYTRACLEANNKFRDFTSFALIFLTSILSLPTLMIIFVVVATTTVVISILVVVVVADIIIIIFVVVTDIIITTR